MVQILHTNKRHIATNLLKNNVCFFTSALNGHPTHILFFVVPVFDILGLNCIDVDRELVCTFAFTKQPLNAH